jgi:hypothetical protein
VDGRRDYLIEVIERAGSALAALVTGRSAPHEQDEDEDVEAAFAREFGELHEQLRKVDASSAALLLRPPRRVRLYALMLIQRAGAVDESVSRRALELLLAADAMDGERSEAALVAALVGAVDVTRLEPEARAMLLARRLL